MDSYCQYLIKLESFIFYKLFLEYDIVLLNIVKLINNKYNT